MYETILKTVFLMMSINTLAQFFLFGIFNNIYGHEDETQRINPNGGPLTRQEIARMTMDRLHTDRFCELEIASGSDIENNSDKALSCCICLAEFGSDDRATALECHHRHIFHEHCLQSSLEVKLACPICRKAVLPLEQPPI
mmetsp:Transcript_31523/g.41743  ORF Transcript_31523/g.41743 Transcript_31523/m.41743 type:complete len:141 (+) Transcript_31523:621-1043(+)|eukprot:CAMPEP_0185578528 /NCGR_PEP_ID=MMETSP0434-20130131/12985_1 /TAXON_ID=626734 ORGANISM="Favella taraikaensis, Strain Fe Narragansett Bay" /NCGR_SAMPLE_ID=MMETSP0434 /ASSEMBLY_ACC=CAM_ASM_000379 /LENGTH=140 /DNA_ID=CAMNT_0028196349 /DNA_START=608 /DNA_END=1030 /DNA_ORIENTATION=+